MYPIHMQDGARGVGMGYHDFLETFHFVCREHIREGRARAFAFIFYDMGHGILSEALMQQGFLRLHDRTSTDITLFYLHSEALGLYGKDFNAKFMEILGIRNHARIPCMVFFRVIENSIQDVSIYHIDEKSPDSAVMVAELEQYVCEAIKELNAEGDISGLTSPLISLGSLIAKLRAFIA